MVFDVARPRTLALLPPTLLVPKGYRFPCEEAVGILFVAAIDTTTLAQSW
jgi:hypothetical protein